MTSIFATNELPIITKKRKMVFFELPRETSPSWYKKNVIVNKNICKNNLPDQRWPNAATKVAIRTITLI